MLFRILRITLLLALVAILGGIYGTPRAQHFLANSLSSAVSTERSPLRIIRGTTQPNATHEPRTLIFVDGFNYPTIAAAVAALPPTGGEVWTPPNYNETITKQLLLGSNAILNTKYVKLRLGQNSHLIVNVLSRGCAIIVPSSSSIVADGSLGNGAPVIELAPTANVSAMICNGDMTNYAQEFFNLADLLLVGNASATVSKALVWLNSVFANSYIRDTTILPNGHIGLLLENGVGSRGGFGPFLCDNCWLNGAIDVTGVFCTSGSEREFTLEERWYAYETVQTGAGRNAAAAN